MPESLLAMVNPEEETPWRSVFAAVVKPEPVPAFCQWAMVSLSLPRRRTAT